MLFHSISITFFFFKFQSNVPQTKTFDIIGGIIEIADQLVKQVQIALDHMSEEAGNTIERIGDQIESFFEAAGQAIENYADQVQQEIESLIADQILPCLVGRSEEIETIRNETHENVAECRSNSIARLQNLVEELEVYVNNTRDEISEIRLSIRTCLDEQDLGEKIKCAVDASRVIRASVGAIFENIRNASQTITSEVYTTATEHYQCVTQAREEGRIKTIQVLNEVRDCIANSTNTTSGN